MKPSPAPEFLEALLGIRDAEAQRDFITRQGVVASLETIQQLSRSIREQLPKDRPLAEALAESNLLLAERLNTPRAWAMAYECKAYVFHNMKRCAEARPYFEKAIGLFERAGANQELGRTLCLFADNLAYLGEYDRASALAAKGRDLLEAAGDTEFLPRSHITLGNLLHRLGRFEESLGEYDCADRLLEDGSDYMAVAAVRLNRSLVLTALTRFDEAIQSFEDAREYCARHGIGMWAEILDRNIADLYSKLGRYSEALRSLEKVRLRYRAEGDERRLALADLNRAEIYLHLNLPEEAAGLAERAAAVFRKHGNQLEEGLCRMAIGMARSDRGDLGGARESLLEGRELLAGEGNGAFATVATLKLSELAHKEGNLVEAEELARSALEAFEGGKLPVQATYARILLARILRSQGRRSEAVEEASEALRDLSEDHAKWLSYQGLALLAGLRAENGELIEAEALYRRAIHQMESLRGSLQFDEFRMSFGRHKYQVYANLVDLMMQTGRPDEAFEWVERSKSRALLDLLEHNTTAVGQVPPSSPKQQRFRKLRQDLNALYSQLAEAGRPVGALRPVQEEIARREAEMVQLLRDAASEQEEWAALEETPSLEPRDVMDMLSPDEVLVEYYLVRGRFCAFVVEADGMHLVEDLGPEEVVRASVRGLQFQFSKFDLGEEYVHSRRQSLLEGTQYHLRQLYEMLLAPLMDRIGHRSLVVIPHQALHYVPFQALFDGKEYVVDRHDVTYCASAAVLKICREKPTPVRDEDLVLAVPDQATPSISEEARLLADLLPDARVFVGPEARTDLLRTLGPRARKLHIAAHGVFRSDNPMFSALRLGDEWLNLVDVFGLELGAELTTLSACETGMNALYEGDELLGLARGFLYAGTPSLVVSLWRVNDRSTASLMRAFYEGLEAGLSKSQALREAALEVKRRLPHPYYWAPFVLMGRS